MRATDTHVVALVTCPDITVARTLARSSLEARLCACVQLVPGIESHYWWEEKLESAQEILLVFKTTKLLVRALEAHVLQKHPYNTPQFVVLDITAGSERYLDWLNAEARPPSLRAC